MFIKYFADRFLLGFQGHLALVAGGHPAPDGSDYILQHFSPAGSVSWSWLLPIPDRGRSGPEGSGATGAGRSPPGWRRERCPNGIPDSATRWPTPVNAYAGAASCALLPPALPRLHSRSDLPEGNCPRIVGVEDPNARPCTPSAKAFGLRPPSSWSPIGCPRCPPPRRWEDHLFRLPRFPLNSTGHCQTRLPGPWRTGPSP